MAHQRAFSGRSRPVPEFDALYGVKYICHVFGHLERPAIMESPSNKLFVTVTW